MAIPSADRVQPIKWESVSEGGSETDEFPSGVDPRQDALEMRGVYLQDPSPTERDEDVWISRDGDNLAFKDKTVSEKVTLEMIVAAMAEGYARYYIGPSETITVPQYRQYINYRRVVLDGCLHVDGQGVI